MQTVRPTEPGSIFKQEPQKIPTHIKVWKVQFYPHCLTLPIQQSRSRDKLPGFQSLLLHLLAVCPYVNSLNSLSLLSSVKFITITYLIRFLWGYSIIFRYYSMLKRLLTVLSGGLGAPQWQGISSVYSWSLLCPLASRLTHMVYQWAALSSSSQGEPWIKRKGRSGYLLPRLPPCWVISGRLVPPPKSPIKVTFPAGVSLFLGSGC